MNFKGIGGIGGIGDRPEWHYVKEVLVISTV